MFSEDIGASKLIVAQNADGYVGTIWQGGQARETIEHADLEVLKASLRNLAGTLHPDYYGIEGAKGRFCSFFPGDFGDATYLAKERDYKDKARSALNSAVPLDRALEADAGDALGCRKGLATNLLSRFEAARLSEVLASREGPMFVRAAASLAFEPDPQSLQAMEKAIEPHGRGSWPLMTYLPFLWSPETQMFCSPKLRRILPCAWGSFATDYESSLDFDVYLAELELTHWTEGHISDLNPRDRIDVQSFIWVVGSYTDADREEMGR